MSRFQGRFLAARAVKTILDVVLVVGMVFWVALAGYLVLSPALVGPDGRTDVAARVAIGENGFLPIVRFRSPTPAVVSDPALVGGTAELRFETTSLLLSIATIVSFLAATALVLFIVWVLRRILVAVLDGRPFDPENARGLRLLGLLLIVAAVASPLADYLLAAWVLGRVEVEGIALSPPFRMSLTPILAGLLLFALSAIFQQGAELEADRSLTI